MPFKQHCFKGEGFSSSSIVQIRGNVPRLYADIVDSYGFSKSALKLMFSYMQDRKQRVRVNESYSACKTTKIGVSQHCTLLPLYYKV